LHKGLSAHPTTSSRAPGRPNPTFRSNSAWRADGRLLDRAPNKTLNEDGDEGPDTGSAELAVEASDPTLKFSSGDLFAWVPLLNSADDFRDLLVVRRLDLHGGRFGKLHC
jgi:hypothetical protein